MTGRIQCRACQWAGASRPAGSYTVLLPPCCCGLAPAGESPAPPPLRAAKGELGTAALLARLGALLPATEEGADVCVDGADPIDWRRCCSAAAAAAAAGPGPGMRSTRTLRVCSGPSGVAVSESRRALRQANRGGRVSDACVRRELVHAGRHRQAVHSAAGGHRGRAITTPCYTPSSTSKPTSAAAPLFSKKAGPLAAGSSRPASALRSPRSHPAGLRAARRGAAAAGRRRQRAALA